VHISNGLFSKVLFSLVFLQLLRLFPVLFVKRKVLSRKISLFFCQGFVTFCPVSVTVARKLLIDSICFCFLARGSHLLVCVRGLQAVNFRCILLS
jgi:hypothetical protein